MLELTKKPRTEFEITLRVGRKTEHLVMSTSLAQPDAKLLESLQNDLKKRGFVPKSDAVNWREVFKQELEKRPAWATGLRAARTRIGLSQTALAEAIRVTQPDIANMESGKRDIGKKIAERLGKVLNVSYKVFL
jgi:ribosome-binding protein aMBF1 (putative translation factor)